MTWLLILFYVILYLGTFILVNLLRNSLFHFLAYIPFLVLSVSGSGHAASPELPAPAVQPQQHAVQPPLHVEPPQAKIPQQDDIWAALEREPPLMGYNERRVELDYKLSSFLLWTENEISEPQKEALVAMQCEIDERLERALHIYGHDADFIFAKRGEIREYSLYPHNKLPSEHTYATYISQLENNPSQSRPFKRVQEAIQNYEIRR